MNSRLLNLFRTSFVLFLLPGLAFAQHDAGIPQMEDVESLYPGKAYSPWAERSFPSRVYWGETHLHTGLSLDAGLFGNTTGHDTAYRLARGEQVTSAGGQPVKLSRPLDWLVITDHSDMMGIATDIQRGAPNVLAVPKGKEWAEGFAAGGQEAAEAAFDLIGNFSQGTIPGELFGKRSSRPPKNTTSLVGLRPLSASNGRLSPKDSTCTVTWSCATVATGQVWSHP
jgi:hypothetical protein